MERRDVLRSRALIERAYYDLLFQKDGGKVTVKEVLERANVSRGTFYAHYSDISDLAAHVENRIVGSFREILSGVTLSNAVEDTSGQVRRVLDAVLERRDAIRMFLKGSESPRIASKLKQLFTQALADETISGAQSAAAQIVDVCIAGVVFDACMMWVVQDVPCSQEELVETVSTFISGGLTRLYPAQAS